MAEYNKSADFPLISQRSIIAFCNLQGKSVGWNSVPLREPLIISSETPFSAWWNDTSVNTDLELEAAGTAANPAGLRVHFVRESSTQARLEVLAYLPANGSGGWQGLEFGYLSKGSFQLRVRTTGDALRGIAGWDRTYPINVLLLDRDWPYVSVSTSYWRRYVDEDTVENFSMVRHADEVYSWTPSTLDRTDHHELLTLNQTGAEVLAVSNLYWYPKSGVPGAPSYEIAVARRDTSFPLTPGVYWLCLYMMSRYTAENASFKGSGGTSIVPVCVYDPFQDWQLVVATCREPTPEERRRQVENGETPPVAQVLPFCPGKLGDIGAWILANIVTDPDDGVVYPYAPPPTPGDAPEQDGATTVLQSLSYQEGRPIQGLGSFRLRLGDVAGNQWIGYPYLRLISLFESGATLTMTIKTKKVSTYSEYTATNMELGVANPSVEQVQEAGGTLVYSKQNDHTNTQTRYTSTGQCTITMPLTFATWTDGLLTELCNVMKDAADISGGMSVLTTYSETTDHTGHTTSLYTPEPDPPGEQCRITGTVSYTYTYTILEIAASTWTEVKYTETRTGTISGTNVVWDPATQVRTTSTANFALTGYVYSRLTPGGCSCTIGESEWRYNYNGSTWTETSGCPPTSHPLPGQPSNLPGVGLRFGCDDNKGTFYETYGFGNVPTKHYVTEIPATISNTDTQTYETGEPECPSTTESFNVTYTAQATTTSDTPTEPLQVVEITIDENDCSPIASIAWTDANGYEHTAAGSLTTTVYLSKCPTTKTQQMRVTVEVEGEVVPGPTPPTPQTKTYISSELEPTGVNISWQVGASTSQVSDKQSYATARAFFGAGHFLKDAFHSLVVAGTGDVQFGGYTALSAQQLTPTGTATAKGHGGRRTRSSPSDEWSYTGVTEDRWAQVTNRPDLIPSVEDVGARTEAIGGAHSLTTGLLRVIGQLITTGSLSASYKQTLKTADAGGGYLTPSDDPTIEYDSHSYSAQGSKTTTEFSATGREREVHEEITGTDPDAVGLDINPPSGNYLQLYQTKGETLNELECSLSIQFATKAPVGLDVGLN